MKKQFLAICVLSAVMLSSCGSAEDMSVGEVQTTAADNVIYYEGKAFSRDELSDETIKWLETYNSLSDESRLTINYVPYELWSQESFEVYETAEEAEQKSVTEETEITKLDTEPETVSSETSEEIVNRIKSIDNSAYDKYSFSRKYVDEVYDIYLVYRIVGQDVLQEWVDNVFLTKTPEEQEELSTIYQAIVELNVSEDDFRKQNEEYIDYPGMYYSEEIINALYTDDVNEMKRLLTNPWALYYNGEVYAFDEMYADPNIVSGVPADVMNEYLDFIETIDGVRVR